MWIAIGFRVAHCKPISHTALSLLLAAAAAAPPLPRLLLWAGGHLNVSGVKSAALLCAAVYEGDMQLLRRLLRAGACADAEDYDKRTALHIAASDGNMPAVRWPTGQCCTHQAWA